MEKYENLGLVGEGSYGMVLKCKHKESGQLVAIKKFLESEDDKMVKKIAMREVRMLKQLRHDHLVNLLEVFKRKKRLYLVFEFVDHTVLDELEKCPNGLDETTTRKILWQVLKGIEFCHHNNIIHRDIKPENILVSKSGVVKLCDFGFARTLAQPGEIYTDYVATRWYRAPELLVGDTKYGRAVDIWAVGCLLAEMLTADPLFPGDSDIDQLYHIVKVFGNLTARHKEVFLRNPLFVGMRLPEVREVVPLEKKLTRISHMSLLLMKESLRLDPDDRPTCTQLLKHEFFTKDGFAQKFTHDLKGKIQREHHSNPLINSLSHEKEDDGKEDTSNNKTTTKKKKKILPPSKKDQESKENKASKESGGKPVKKEDSKESTTDDKPKRKLPESPDKMKPDHPSNHSITLPPAPSQSKQSQGKSVSGENIKQDKLDKHEKHDHKHDKHDKPDKHEKSKSDTVKNSDKDDKPDSKLKADGPVEKHEKDKVDKSSDKDLGSRSESKLDKDKHESKREHSKDKEKGDMRDKDNQDDGRETSNSVSFKDSSSIPPIHATGSNTLTGASSVTPSIPSISSPNMVVHTSPLLLASVNNNMNSPRGTPYTGPMPLRKHTSSFPDGTSPFMLMVNDKMKKPPNFKKNIPNHHSVTLSPQPLQSEKSMLHDKSLEKLRSKIREGTFDRREKELISFPEVRGAEANPGKNNKAKIVSQRPSLATIPHITNIDPFPSSSQVEAHSPEKSENLPSV